MAKQQSRSARWFNAVAKGKTAMEQLEELQDTVSDEILDAMQEMRDKIQTLIDAATDKVSEAARTAEEAVQELNELKEEYQDWYDNMPEQLQDGPTGEKLSEITYMDFDWEPELELEVPEFEDPTLELDLGALEDIFETADSADLPLGFGRD